MDIEKISNLECEIKKKVEDKAWKFGIDLESLNQSVMNKLNDPEFQDYLERVEEDIEGEYYDQYLDLTIVYTTYFKNNKIIIINIDEGIQIIWDYENEEEDEY